MADIKPMTCPNCGAPINTKRLICEYCGTTFKEEQAFAPFPKPQPQYIVTRPGVRTLGVERIVNFWEFENSHEAERYEEFVKEEMAHAIATRIAELKLMEIKKMPRRGTMVAYSARLRVLEPDYRF